MGSNGNGHKITGESCRSESDAIGTLLWMAANAGRIKVDEIVLETAIYEAENGDSRRAKSLLTQAGQINISNPHRCICGHSGWLARLT